VFRWIDDHGMIGLILRIAAYTYGPLFGFAAYALLALDAPEFPTAKADEILIAARNFLDN